MGQIAFTLAYTHRESGAPFAIQYWWGSAHLLIKGERENGKGEKGKRRKGGKGGKGGKGRKEEKRKRAKEEKGNIKEKKGKH